MSRVAAQNGGMPNAALPDAADARLVVVKDLVKEFRHRSSRESMRAVDGVSLHLDRGETLGLVGESGSGKTTTGRCILGLIPVTGGTLHIDGVELAELSRRQLLLFRKKMQMVFQNPYDSLSPRWRIKSIIEEPLILQTDMDKSVRQRRISELLELVRLDRDVLSRYPHQLSGGQQQRVGIARALATNPELVVLDEPTSALDTITRTEILDLLNSLRRELRLSYLFISHDLSAVRRVCDRIAVMYLGKIVEEAETETLFGDPQHPYTRALLSAVLKPRIGGRGKRARLHGEPPSPIDPPSGCRFHPRCPISAAACAATDQTLELTGPGHSIACSRLTGGEHVEWPAGWHEMSATGRQGSPPPA